MFRTCLIATSFLAFTLASSNSVAGDVVVIANKANAEAVDLAFVTKVYTGAASSWPDGTALTPLDNGDEGTRNSFGSMIGKTPSSLKATWANLMFSGKGTPPKVMATDAEIKAAVSANKAMIGYIKSSSVDDSVKVLVK